MFKFLFLISILFSNTFAIDFKKLKEDIYLYIDALDHPNREAGNMFSENLAIAGNSMYTNITIY